MAWYRTGKIAINKSSKVVTGTGTDFIDAVRPGFVLQAPDGKVYEVDNVLTATVMHIVEPYAGNSVSNADFAIWQTQGEIPALAKTATDLIGRFGRIADAFDTGILEPVLSGQIIDVAEGVASAKQATTQAGLEAEKALVEANRAQAAADNAAAIVTGGTATLVPAAAKIPLARADATVDPNWLGVTELPLIRPVFAADFTKGVVDPRVVHTRSSIGIEIGQTGAMRTASINEPRLDFDTLTGLCRGMLTEPQVTNVIVDSSKPFTPGGSAGTSPPVVKQTTHLGVACTEVTFTPEMGAGWTSSRVQGSNFALVPGVVALSARIALSRPLVGTEALYFRETGAIGGIPIIINKDFPVGFARHVVVNTFATSGNNYPSLFVERAISSPITVYITDVQREVGGAATSIIPTSGAQVTRSTDNFHIPLDDSWFNRTEGTLFFSCEDVNEAAGFALMLHVDGNNYIGLDNVANATTRPGHTYMKHKGVFYINGNLYTPRGPRRYACSWKAGAAVLTSINGIHNSAAPTALPADYSCQAQSILIGGGTNGFRTPAFREIFGSIRYYDKALTAAQLSALTA